MFGNDHAGALPQLLVNTVVKGERKMKTSENVNESGLYVSSCCLEEMTLEKNDCFKRCPRCEALCEWELVELPEFETERQAVKPAA
jgi:hypothetical protein